MVNFIFRNRGVKNATTNLVLKSIELIGNIITIKLILLYGGPLGYGKYILLLSIIQMGRFVDFVPASTAKVILLHNDDATSIERIYKNLLNFNFLFFILVTITISCFLYYYKLSGKITINEIYAFIPVVVVYLVSERAQGVCRSIIQGLTYEYRLFKLLLVLRMFSLLTEITTLYYTKNFISIFLVKILFETLRFKILSRFISKNFTDKLNKNLLIKNQTNPWIFSSLNIQIYISSTLNLIIGFPEVFILTKTLSTYNVGIITIAYILPLKFLDYVNLALSGYAVNLGKIILSNGTGEILKYKLIINLILTLISILVISFNNSIYKILGINNLEINFMTKFYLLWMIVVRVNYTDNLRIISMLNFQTVVLKIQLLMVCIMMFGLVLDYNREINNILNYFTIFTAVTYSLGFLISLVFINNIDKKKSLKLPIGNLS